MSGNGDGIGTGIPARLIRLLDVRRSFRSKVLAALLLCVILVVGVAYTSGLFSYETLAPKAVSESPNAGRSVRIIWLNVVS